jgi:mRNA-degrading endonuclease HigB of HigAB toxin-antitoxin module
MTRDVKNMSRMLSNTKEMTRGCWAMLGKLQKTCRNFFAVIMKDAWKTPNSAKEMLGDIKQC